MFSALNKVWAALTALCITANIAHADVACHADCTPNISNCQNSCGQWSFEADVLYWTACEEGLTYGSETDANLNPFSAARSQTARLPLIFPIDPTYITKKKHPHTRWDLGYRLGLGYQFPCECWNADFIWTHFNTDSHGKHSKVPSSSNFFTPAWGSIPVTGVVTGPLFGGVPPSHGNLFPVDEAHAHWKLRLNLLDLEIGREFCVNSCLTLRPFIGVRGAFINEKYDLEYHSKTVVTVGIVTTTTDAKDNTRLKNDFEGAGVRGGLDTNYDLGCGVSLYGGVAASLLYGETEIKGKEAVTFTRTITGTLPPTVTSVFEHEQKERDCGVRAITDAEIGFRWIHCCCEKLITLQFGWEHHFFFNQSQFEKFTNFNGSDNFATNRFPQNIHGDMSIQGLVLSGKVYF